MKDDNFVRVQCDFCADGLWDRRGRAMTPETIGLSPALSLALHAWQAHYEEYLPGRSQQHFDSELHEKIGRQIAALVKVERPDLHVVYGGDEPYPGSHLLGTDPARP
jgi:hypothetical protein